MFKLDLKPIAAMIIIVSVITSLAFTIHGEFLNESPDSGLYYIILVRIFKVASIISIAGSVWRYIAE